MCILALRYDFNLLDGFRIFDSEGKGFITTYELELGLKKIHMNPTVEEVYLFMRGFDKDANGKLIYSDFCKAFTPKVQQYATLLTSEDCYL